ncbi:apocarotenoid-15,15'-oxygenase [Caulobacter sp. D4A]|uniref:carotenoid oxygenase family protein n=1 Tax=unclassified Caulobacter TaxID=2648921 RepID=UPI000D73CD17|nr:MULTISPECIES: carotenoid oxygenase family protein [unclassified Caulobacter]PXA79490.1 apocarotenoid-15,15'-oxygenase [Caulobacter sp. D4A]PXA89031.1 apocarotenoid-15,15'-oxygenase [Caulobacter sp. D5]
MKVARQPSVRTSLRPTDHPYMTGAWTPQHEELDAEDLVVLEGAIPAELDGIYLRNTENPVHDPLGRYHPFDGDGMVHQIDFHGGRARYRNRFVRTRGFEAEQEAGQSLWGGLADGPGVSLRPGFGAHGGLKDSASTDIVVHAGEAIATFYQCGEAYRLDPLTLETLGPAPWAPIDGVSAHTKVDPVTGELLFFNYSKHAPYMHYGVVDRTGRRTLYQPVPLPGPRLPHDMAFSQNWAIFNDLPVFWDAGLLERGIHAVRLHKGVPSRFALVPRQGGEPRWFEAAPTYVLHFLNAYEEGDEVVVDGYFQENPTPRPLADAPEQYAHLMAYLDEHSFRPKLHRWRFNLATGQTLEQRLDDRVLEFGMFNQAWAGKPYRYAWSTTAKPGWFLFDGFVKHDLVSGESWSLKLPEGRYASEAPFAARPGAVGEDDGWLVSFVIDEGQGTSECLIVDARSMAPVCRVALPHKISSGTHSVWAGRSELKPLP